MDEVKLIDFGWIIGKLEQYNLLLLQPADSCEHAYAPPQSINIYGEDNLIKLRDALNEIFPKSE